MFDEIRQIQFDFYYFLKEYQLKKKKSDFYVAIENGNIEAVRSIFAKGDIDINKIYILHQKLRLFQMVFIDIVLTPFLMKFQNIFQK